ncbi:MAG: hypothetical protein AAB152_15515 [Candidatus Coatesbacteria bacterium]
MKRLPPLEPVAGEVCAALRANGVEAILVGGGVVTIYSENEYKSLDLDFVVRGRDAAIIEAMASIGFRKGRGRHFERKGTIYIVEFLPPPPGIGRVIVDHFATRRTSGGLLTLYDPTHCVMDRLAAFYHWSDPQGLDQAVMVARRHRIRQEKVRRWSKGEGMSARYAEFRARLAAARSRS